MAELKYSRLVTERFLKEMDRIIGRKDGVKVTQNMFADIVGITSSNLTRLRRSQDNYVTLDALCKMIEHYGTSPVWLMTGEVPDKNVGDMAGKAYRELDQRLKKVEKQLNGVTKGPKLKPAAVKKKS